MMVSFESFFDKQEISDFWTTKFQVYVFGKKYPGQFDIRTCKFEQCLTELVVQLQVLVEEKCPVAYLNVRSVQTMWIPPAKRDYRLFGRAMRPDYTLEHNYSLSFSCESLLELSGYLDTVPVREVLVACTKFCEVQKAVHKITHQVFVLLETSQKLQGIFSKQREAMMEIDLNRPEQVQQTLQKVNRTCSSVDRSLRDLAIDLHCKTSEITVFVKDLHFYKFSSNACNPEDWLLFNQFMMEVSIDSLKEAQGHLADHAEMMSSRCVDLNAVLRDLTHPRRVDLKQRLLQADDIVKIIDSLPEKLEESLKGVPDILRRRYLSMNENI